MLVANGIAGWHGREVPTRYTMTRHGRDAHATMESDLGETPKPPRTDERC